MAEVLEGVTMGLISPSGSLLLASICRCRIPIEGENRTCDAICACDDRDFSALAGWVGKRLAEPCRGLLDGPRPAPPSPCACESISFEDD